MSQPASYSDHREVLTALVSYLALTQQKSRTPTGLAMDLGLDKDDVHAALDGFPGLFRRSRNPSNRSEQPGEHFYTLHVRYATRRIEDEREEASDEPPLASGYLESLLNIISSRAGHELEHAREEARGRLTLLGAWVAAVAAILAATISAVSR
ncbi:MAG: hypothetical protein ACE5FA_00875 [Dehalococcoidia bacterium]